MYFDWLSNQLLQGDYQASLAIYKKKGFEKGSLPKGSAQNVNTIYIK